MGAVISAIEKGSLADQAGMIAGEKILSVNGEDFHDILEYRFLCSDEEIRLNIEGRGEVVIQKEYYEDLGIEFENPLIEKAKHCCNHCVFCFIDQLPKGLRDTLYFKDDDARLSFLHGNYITMTNMTRREMESVVKMRISPVNISVHATDPELRAKMLNNPRAKQILEQIAYFAEHSITMNCQIVACPGLNDGEQFSKTVRDLMEFYPHIRSVSVVPVGLSKYRDTLYPLKSFDRAGAQDIVKRVQALQKECRKRFKTRFIYAGDEFYLKAGVKLPKDKEYEAYYQIENGVGMLASLEHDVKRDLRRLKADRSERTVSIATGELAHPFMERLAAKTAKKAKGLKVHTYKIKNHFFGETITVAGLLTGQDLISQLKGKELGETLYITKNMLKQEEDIFLDGITLQELQDALHVKVTALSDGEFLKIAERADG